jgi:hypothetical protein
MAQTEDEEPTFEDEDPITQHCPASLEPCNTPSGTEESGGPGIRASPVPSAFIAVRPEGTSPASNQRTTSQQHGVGGPPRPHPSRPGTSAAAERPKFVSTSTMPFDNLESQTLNSRRSRSGNTGKPRHMQPIEVAAAQAEEG